jgi:hypothetical protein
LEEIEKDCIESDDHFIGKNTWLKELKAVEKIIKTGITNGWGVNDEDYVYE